MNPFCRLPRLDLGTVETTAWCNCGIDSGEDRVGFSVRTGNRRDGGGAAFHDPTVARSRLHRVPFANHPASWAVSAYAGIARQHQVGSAVPPSVNELRQVVPGSDMCGRPGTGPARCRMAGGYRHQPKPAGQLGVSERIVERLVAASSKRGPIGMARWVVRWARTGVRRA